MPNNIEQIENINDLVPKNHQIDNWRCLITSTQEEPNTPQRISNYRWVVLSASFFAFVIWAFVFQLVPPLLNDFQDQFNVGDAESGLLMSMAVVPGILLALPAGFIVDKYGFRSTGSLSIVSVAAGSLITALANTFATALLGRLILGVGGAFLIVGAPAIVPQWFSHEELGKAMGIYATNMPLATIIAFPVATVLAQNFGWRYPFYVGALVSLFCALVFALAMREDPSKGKHEPVRLEETRHAIKSVEVWKAGLVWLFFETAAIGFLSWAPKSFQTLKGLTPFYASVSASIFMYSALIFVLLFGWASDKFGRKKPFIFLGSVLMAMILVSIAYADGLTLFLSVAALGVSAAMAPPPLMAIVAESLPPRLSGMGFSIITLCQNIGITLSGPVGGYLLQSTQSLPLTFLGISSFAIAGAVTALTIKNK